jgi:hypothetical protein
LEKSRWHVLEADAFWSGRQRRAYIGIHSSTVQYDKDIALYEGAMTGVSLSRLPVLRETAP